MHLLNEDGLSHRKEEPTQKQEILQVREQTQKVARVLHQETREIWVVPHCVLVDLEELRRELKCLYNQSGITL